MVQRIQVADRLFYHNQSRGGESDLISSGSRKLSEIMFFFKLSASEFYSVLKCFESEFDPSKFWSARPEEMSDAFERRRNPNF